MGELTIDLRGSEKNIARLSRISKEALVHMIVYRILIFLCLITGVLFFVSILVPQVNYLDLLFKSLFVLVWILFSVQLFETAKASVDIATRGFVLGKLEDSYKREIKNRNKKLDMLLGTLPYFAVLVWLAGFILLILLWLV